MGLFVSPSHPWLGVSVDGVVVQDNIITTIVEVKCPSSCEKVPVYDDNTKKCNVNYLIMENNIFELTKSSQSYTQCQMQMFATGLRSYDLFVWYPVGGSCVVEIHYDDKFVFQTIPRLQEFYFNHFLPAICKEYGEHV